VASTPLSGSNGASVKAKPKRRLSCKTSDTPDASRGMVSGTTTGVTSPELAAPRRRLKRSATVAGLTERCMPVPFVASNLMSTSAAESLGALLSVSKVNVIEASPRHRAMPRTSSSAVPESVSINGDREDAVVIESDQFPGDVFAGATDRVSPADALTPETQQEQHASGTPSPARQLLREETTLSRQLSRVMSESSSNEAVPGETQQPLDFGVVASPPRRIKRKTSSSCDPVPADRSVPPVVLPREEIWRRFTPSVIDPLLCLARTYNGGAGGQCRRKPKAGEVICGNCNKLAHGRVDGPIPEIKLAHFLRLAGDT